jgi:hypothetical protein
MTPLFVRPWADTDSEKAINRWAAAWPVIGGTPRKPVEAPEARLVKRVTIGNRGRTALDVTLKTWAAFAGDEQETGRRGAYDFYVRGTLEDVEKQRPVMTVLAAAALDAGGGLLHRDQMLEVVKTALTGADGKVPANVTETFDKVIGTANKNGLLVDGPGNAYLFRHPLLAGFLAAETLIDAPPDRLEAIAANPAWDVALPPLYSSG